MSSILEILELTQSSRRSTARDPQHGEHTNPISQSCRALLEEAQALGPDVDEVIDTVRRCAARPNHSN